VDRITNDINMDNNHAITNPKIASLLSSTATTSLSEANEKKSNVFIRDPVAVAKKLEKMLKDGVEALHVISGEY
jgi:CRISPR/Cas system-associated endonuclease/helicase Cas3